MILNLGSNQLLLLKRALYSRKKYLDVVDVNRVYGYRDRDKCIVVLEKLEIKGILFRIDKKRWNLTEQGKTIVKERLKSIRNGVNG